MDHVVLTIENVGTETAENHAPQIWIEFGDDVIFDNRKRLSNAQSLGSIPPTSNVGFEMIDLLSTGSQFMENALKLYGVEAALIDKEFVVYTISNYTAPDGIRKFTSPIFTLRFVWTSKIKNKLTAIIRDTYEG